MPEKTQAFAAQAPTSAPGAYLHHSLSATDHCLWSLYLLSSKGTKGPPCLACITRSTSWLSSSSAIVCPCKPHQQLPDTSPWQSRMSGSVHGHDRLWRTAGGEEGPRFQALPEPAPLPPLPRPTQPMSDAPAPAPMAGALAEYQVRANRSQHDSAGFQMLKLQICCTYGHLSL